jgi:multisubunit Na+/H+ antiporter MnhF subunit
LIPTLVGVRIGIAPRAPADDFYSTSAQVIATLFLAITVEFFARQAAGRGMQDAVVALVLAGQSWIGFFACLRALTGAATDLTRGLTAMGITAASVLLSLALYDRMAARTDVSQREKSVAAVIVLIVLFAAIALLIY